MMPQTTERSPLEPQTTRGASISKWEEEFRRYKDTLRIKKEQRAKIREGMEAKAPLYTSTGLKSEETLPTTRTMPSERISKRLEETSLPSTSFRSERTSLPTTTSMKPKPKIEGTSLTSTQGISTESLRTTAPKTMTTSSLPQTVQQPVESRETFESLRMEEEGGVIPEKAVKMEQPPLAARSAGIEGSYDTSRLKEEMEQRDIRSEEYGVKLIKSQWVPSKTVVLRDEVGISISPESIGKFPVEPEEYFPEVSEEIHLGIEDETELVHRVGVKCGIHLQALTRDLNRLTSLIEGPIIRPYRRDSIFCLVNLLDDLDRMDLEIKTLLHNISRDQRERELILKQMLCEEEEDETREIEALRKRAFDRIVKERIIVPKKRVVEQEVPERPITSYFQEKVEVEVEEKAPEIKEVVKEVIKEVPVEKEVIKEVPVEKEVIKEIPVEKEIVKEVPVIQEVIKEVPKEIEVIKEVVKTVPEIREVIKEVPKEVEIIKEVVKEVPVEKEVIKEIPVIQEVIKEVPKEVEVIKEVVQKVPEVQEVIKEVIKEVPVEKEVIKEVPVEKEVIKEVPVEKEVIKEVEIVKEVPVEKEIIKEVPVMKEVPIQQVILPDVKSVKTEEIITEKKVNVQPEIQETGRVIEERVVEPVSTMTTTPVKGEKVLEEKTETTVSEIPEGKFAFEKEVPISKTKEERKTPLKTVSSIPLTSTQTPTTVSTPLTTTPSTTKTTLAEERPTLLRKGTTRWSSMKFHPSFDVQETSNSIILSSLLPGVKKEELHLDVGKDYFTIEGLKEPTLDEETRLREEVSLSHPGEKNLEDFTLLAGSGKYGSFSETYRLPQSVDPGKIKASYQGGVLQVICPKRETQNISAF